MNLDSPTTSSKRCVVCGKDVSQAKRTKDSSGRYYCAACYEARTSAAQTTPIAASTPEPATRNVGRYVAIAAAVVLTVGIAGATYFWFAPSSKTIDVTKPSRAATTTEVNQKNSNGRTALNLAVASGRQKEVEALVDKGADVNAKDSDGATPLHAAARRGHPDLAKFLIFRNAAIDAKDDDGATPLHLAAANGNKGVAEFLLSRGADINAKDKKDRTPLALAKERKHPKMVEYLRGQGAAK